MIMITLVLPGRSSADICVHNRHIFEEQGCKFAPVEVAKDFSHESPLDVNRGIVPFGYHGNLPAGVVIS